MAGLPKLETLYLKGNKITNLDPLLKLPKLRRLGLSEIKINVLVPLQRLHSLVELHLANTGISKYSFITRMTHLQILAVGRNHIKDITFLEGLTDMRKLYIYNNEITDISVLAGMKKLTDLEIFDNQISDLGPIADHHQLVYLHAMTNQIEDLAPIAGLTALERLFIGGNKITDISVLANMTKLRKINLDENDIVDLSPLAHATLLDCFNMTDNKRLEDIRPLAGLPLLDTVILDNSSVSDITPLASLPKLEIVFLDDNHIEDISALAGLLKVRKLYLENNLIRDLSPLVKNCYAGGLGKGDEVRLAGNPISEESLARDVPALREAGVKVMGVPAAPDDRKQGSEEPKPAKETIHSVAQAGDREKAEAMLNGDPALANAKNKEGMTPLHLAVQNGDTVMVLLLLKKGADPEIINGNGWTALSKARDDVTRATIIFPEPGQEIFKAAALGRTERVKDLIAKKPALLDAPDFAGVTPPGPGGRRRTAEGVAFLLSKHAKVDIRDNHDRTALYSAIGKDMYMASSLVIRGAGNQEMCEFLLAQSSKGQNLPYFPGLGQEEGKEAYDAAKYCAGLIGHLPPADRKGSHLRL